MFGWAVGTWGLILEKTKKVEAGFWGKVPVTVNQQAFLFEKPAKSQSEPSGKATKFYSWRFGPQNLENRIPFPRRFKKIELKILQKFRQLKRFWGSNLDLFRKVESHFKIDPYKKWV